jgi:hypothetical protein
MAGTYQFRQITRPICADIAHETSLLSSNAGTESRAPLSPPFGVYLVIVALVLWTCGCFPDTLKEFPYTLGARHPMRLFPLVGIFPCPEQSNKKEHTT